MIHLEKSAGFGRFGRGMVRFRLDEGTDSHTSDVGHWFGMTTQEADANNPSVMADGHDTSAALRRTTQCAPQGYLLRGEHWAAFIQGRRMPRRCRGIGAMWASPPTEGLSGVRSFVVSPSGASRHLPRRGRRMPRRCRGSGAMHPKGTCSASLHCVGIAPYGTFIGAFRARVTYSF